MIGKILPHKRTFGRRTTYVRYEKQSERSRDTWTVLRNLDGVDPDYADKVMTATAQQSRRVQKPCGHLILSWTQDDHVCDDTMVQQADITMRDLGLSAHQAMYVAHDDTDHRHVHIIFNRVHPETYRAASDSNERIKLRKSLMQQEQDYGLTQTPFLSRGRHDRPMFCDVEMARRNDQESLVRMSKERCVKLKEELSYCFQIAHGWTSFHSALKRRGYDLIKAGKGVRIVRHYKYAKLSDVAPPKLSAKKLTEKWGKFADYWDRIEPPELQQKNKRIQNQKQTPQF